MVELRDSFQDRWIQWSKEKASAYRVEEQKHPVNAVLNEGQADVPLANAVGIQ